MSVSVTFVGSGDAFGASSLIALNKMGINHNSIYTIILIQIHGDHCGGIPFMLMAAMPSAK